MSIETWEQLYHASHVKPLNEFKQSSSVGRRILFHCQEWLQETLPLSEHCSRFEQYSQDNNNRSVCSICNSILPLDLDGVSTCDRCNVDYRLKHSRVFMIVENHRHRAQQILVDECFQGILPQLASIILDFSHGPGVHTFQLDKLVVSFECQQVIRQLYQLFHPANRFNLPSVHLDVPSFIMVMKSTIFVQPQKTTLVKPHNWILLTQSWIQEQFYSVNPSFADPLNIEQLNLNQLAVWELPVRAEAVLPIRRNLRERPLIESDFVLPFLESPDGFNCGLVQL